MKQYIILAMLLYALFVLLYLFWERMVKRKKNAAKKSAFNLFRSTPKEDIIGKSKFDLRQSRTEATTLIHNEKRIENSNTFADESKKDAPVATLLGEAETVLSDENMTDENSNEINLTIENTPPEFEPEYKEDLDEDETEDEDTEGVAGVSIALGLDFNDLAGMIRTVDNNEQASDGQKEEAGRVLVEIRKTELFEQVVNEEPKKKAVVSALMDDYFAAFHRRKREAGEINEPTVKAPKEFDARSFA